METKVALGEEVAGYTLVVPSVSIGNTAQLAVDLLTETFEYQVETQARHNAVLPFAGPKDEGASNAIVTEMQVHVSHTHKLVVLQIRSAIARQRREEFVQDLFKWIQSKSFGRTLLLTSTDAMHRIDSQLEGSPLRALSTTDDSSTYAPLKTLELHTDSALPNSVFLPGGGFARQLFLNALEVDLPMTLVSIFTGPGDNTMQAHMLGLRVPSSWKLLFGRGFGPGLF
ncbi:hypothetical protein PTSG_01347 [Salpingoeca rosetta]|uniref:Proteasome assembly chaperone 2 n=1 Tax=Salpingoeca rosetta (strain ATCC 50818 / BSB-021) TaxID=946362 RepID=F2U030_SALR5|nr:uncharacterized protein PTSG_01347 [Salpingoeca rosetta]EGD80758.1 hypothetical protein PTSG_01347 [Salpingoeca rosetta]|eukprot:XP_004997319.1 hypothetical protein PTSG_01347 [Salpingoeca rosetta]